MYSFSLIATRPSKFPFEVVQVLPKTYYSLEIVLNVIKISAYQLWSHSGQGEEAVRYIFIGCPWSPKSIVLVLVLRVPDQWPGSSVFLVLMGLSVILLILLYTIMYYYVLLCCIIEY